MKKKLVFAQIPCLSIKMEINNLVKSNEDLIFSSSLSASRTEEKAALGLLNHRFGNFIERMKTIVNYNEELQARIDQVRKEGNAFICIWKQTV